MRTLELEFQEKMNKETQNNVEQSGCASNSEPKSTVSHASQQNAQNKTPQQSTVSHALQQNDSAKTMSENKVQLAVFDLDGTCLDGSSTVRLVLDLLKHGKLFLHTGVVIGFWGLAYKLKLPQNEAWVRSKVWKAFVGKPKDKVDEFLRNYVDRVVEKIWRDAATKEIEKHHAQGREVVLVSASFEPIVCRVCELHNVDHQISTRMKVDASGAYLRQVDGMPIEGIQKVLALRAYADGRFGEGSWVVSHAYADHYSDIPMLEFAQTPHAICPDRALLKHAENNDWDVVLWDEVSQT